MEHSEQQGNTPGEILRAAREALGVSPREMADRLNWMPTYLVAIEENRFEVLRGTAFVRGYLRAYARQLNLQESALLSAFEAMQKPQLETDEEDAQGDAQSVFRQPGVGIALGLVIAVLLIAGLWWGQGDEPQKPAAVTNVSQGSSIKDTQERAAAEEALLIAAEEVAAAGDALEQAAVEEAYTDAGLELESTEISEENSEAYVVPLPTDTDTLEAPLEAEVVARAAATVVGDAILQFQFSGDCWVEVRDGNDQLIYSDLRLDGDSLNLNGESPFNILVGDARFVELQYQGEPFIITPRPGRVIARFTVGAP